MAIKVNDAPSGEGFSGKLYNGIAILKVIGVNPTQEELRSYGYKAEKAPVYFENKDGVNNLRVVFMVETKVGDETIRFAAPAIFLRNKKADAFINKQGQLNKDATKLEGEIRNPYEGEFDLLNFIRVLASVKTKEGEELYLDTIDQMVATGNIAELHAIVNACKAKNKMFKAYLTVRNGKYQSFYMRKIEYPTTTDYSWIHRDMANQRNFIKDDLGTIDLDMYNPADFNLREWVGAAGVTQSTASRNPVLYAAAAAASAAVRSNGVQAAGAQAIAADDDDGSPF